LLLLLPLLGHKRNIFNGKEWITCLTISSVERVDEGVIQKKQSTDLIVPRTDRQPHVKSANCIPHQLRQQQRSLLNGLIVVSLSVLMPSRETSLMNRPRRKTPIKQRKLLIMAVANPCVRPASVHPDLYTADRRAASAQTYKARVTWSIVLSVVGTME
jgi:hypothetical protein